MPAWDKKALKLGEYALGIAAHMFQHMAVQDEVEAPARQFRQVAAKIDLADGREVARIAGRVGISGEVALVQKLGITFGERQLWRDVHDTQAGTEQPLLLKDQPQQPRAFHGVTACAARILPAVEGQELGRLADRAAQVHQASLRVKKVALT